MNPTTDGRRVTSALRFLAELSIVAEECAATVVWDDELTVRRRLRSDVRSVDGRSMFREAKAL
jgi:hypothetical protein